MHGEYTSMGSSNSIKLNYASFIHLLIFWGGINKLSNSIFRVFELLRDSLIASFAKGTRISLWRCRANKNTSIKNYLVRLPGDALWVIWLALSAYIREQHVWSTSYNTKWCSLKKRHMRIPLSCNFIMAWVCDKCDWHHLRWVRTKE